MCDLRKSKTDSSIPKPRQRWRLRNKGNDKGPDVSSGTSMPLELPAAKSVPNWTQISEVESTKRVCRWVHARRIVRRRCITTLSWKRIPALTYLKKETSQFGWTPMVAVRRGSLYTYCDMKIFDHGGHVRSKLD